MSIGFGLIKSIIEKNEPIAKLYEEGIDETYFKDDEKAVKMARELGKRFV